VNAVELLHLLLLQVLVITTKVQSVTDMCIIICIGYKKGRIKLDVLVRITRWGLLAHFIFYEMIFLKCKQSLDQNRSCCVTVGVCVSSCELK